MYKSEVLSKITAYNETICLYNLSYKVLSGDTCLLRRPNYVLGVCACASLNLWTGIAGGKFICQDHNEWPHYI